MNRRLLLTHFCLCPQTLNCSQEGLCPWIEAGPLPDSTLRHPDELEAILKMWNAHKQPGAMTGRPYDERSETILIYLAPVAASREASHPSMWREGLRSFCSQLFKNEREKKISTLLSISESLPTTSVSPLSIITCLHWSLIPISLL